MSSNSINQVKIKKLDGTYDARNLSVNYDNVDGLSDIVPVPTVYDSDKFLKGDGTWGKVSKGVSYGTSPTAADVASKVVTSAGGDFELEEGASINVKFTYGNTAETPTLNIDTLGNKLIKAYGTEAPSLWWNAGDIVNFVYDGTNFIMRPTEGQINEINDEVKSKADFVDKKLATVHLDTKLSVDLVTNTWSTKTWSGLTNILGRSIWTDGDNIYYSNVNHYVLDKSTSTWLTKTWNGYSSFGGINIWTDGENIYYSNDSKQYILDKSTSTWTDKTWTGLTSFGSSYIWTDGENIYYSYGSDQYILDKSTSTWTAKTWNGFSSVYGNCIWSDGEDIYYSYSSSNYVLNKSTSTWSRKTWSGLTSFDARYIWFDGDNIYYSDGSSQYVLNRSTSTWTIKTWTGLSSIDGRQVWTDGDNIYCSNGFSIQYVLDKLEKPFDLTDTRDAIAKINSELTASDNTKFEFTKSGNSYGYKNSSGTFIPFKTVQASKTVTAGTSAQTVTPDSEYDGVASVTVNPTPSQSKTVTASTSAQTVSPDSGNLLSSVVVNPTPSQSKSTSPSTSAQTITPDSGKLLSSVSISAISPVIGWEGATITDGGIDNDKPYVWVPYGYHMDGNNGRNPIFISENTLQNIHRHTGTATNVFNINNSQIDLGEYHNYRIIPSTTVPLWCIIGPTIAVWSSTNATAPYTLTSNETGASTVFSDVSSNTHVPIFSILNVETGSTRVVGTWTNQAYNALTGQWENLGSPVSLSIMATSFYMNKNEDSVTNFGTKYTKARAVVNITSGTVHKMSLMVFWAASIID